MPAIVVSVISGNRREEIAPTFGEVQRWHAFTLNAVALGAMSGEQSLPLFRVGSAIRHANWQQARARHGHTWLGLATQPMQVSNDGLHFRLLCRQLDFTLTKHAGNPLFQRNDLHAFRI
ncbi:hypothetical protein D3C76_1538670 [compost metagenome]